MTSNLKKIESLRKLSGQTLAQAYKDLSDKPFSEASLTQAWLSILRQNSDLYEDGWYVPPPHGIITVFGKADDNFARVSQPSFRPESEWPRIDQFYSPEDIILIYASPIDRQTGLIGDFGLNLYAGANKNIRGHFENVLRATLRIAAYAKSGMEFRELYNFAMDHGKTCGFQNNIESTADAAGTNIGHTLPGSFESDPAKSAIASAQNYKDIKEIIRVNRIFVNGAESQRIGPNMAFTIEPRFSTNSMPNTMFHLTIIFEGGEKRICHGYHPIMKALGMDYLIQLLP